MESKTKTDISPYVVNIQGKDFITFPGLLAEAHARGLVSIVTDLVGNNLTNPIVKATVTMEGNSKSEPVRVFTGYGDANVNNVAKKVAGALLRMAETRAVARALRFACNIDMTALEELGGESEVVETVTNTKVLKPTLTRPSVKEASEPVANIKATTLNVSKRSAAAKLEVNNEEPNF